VVAGKRRGDPLFCNSAWRQMTGGQRNILPLARVSGIRCARGQKTITVADLRRSNARPKQQLNHASKRRSNRLRTIGLRLLSNCNCWSNSAVRNTAVPRQKNLNRPPRNCGRCRRLGRPASRSFTSNWPREKGPAFVGGAKEIVMQRGRLGGIPLPRPYPSSPRGAIPARRS